MPTPPPPQGFLGLPNFNFDALADSVTKFLPPAVTDAIKGTVEKLLDPDEDINIGDPQPEGERPIPVEPGSEELNWAVKAIDTVLSALDVVMKFGFVIPDEYEGYITKLQGALHTIRGWLD